MAEAAERFKTLLEDNGLSVVDWAKANGFNVRTVRAVLSGELKAKRGVSHKIAVATGLKKQPAKRAL